MDKKVNSFKLITLPNQNLRKPSKKVGLINDRTEEIIRHMEEVLLKWENEREHEVGVALAAIQIDVDLKIIIVRDDIEDKDNNKFNVFINPKVTKYEGDIIEDYEGCLSIENIYGKVPRYSKVRISALDISGNPIRLSVKGFMARIFQHEIDHTHGKMFIDHIKNNEGAFFQLMPDGKLKELDYESEVKKNNILW